MRLNKGFLAAGVAAVLLAVAALPGGIASAAPRGEERQAPEHRPVRVMGIVQQVGERGILLQTQRGPVRVMVFERTRILVEQNGQCVEGTLADIEVGARALVAGMTTREPRVIAARGIAQCMPSRSEGDK